MPRFVFIAVVTALLALGSGVASGDEDPRFRRTTPRGSFGREGPALLIGVPGGRAWGIESELRPVPPNGSGATATIAVRDADVREAFIRIAWYDRDFGRPRQIAISDATFVRAGETATVVIPLESPPRAVAYRIRVLARLRSPELLSSPEAIRAVLGPAIPHSHPLTQLLR